MLIKFTKSIFILLWLFCNLSITAQNNFSAIDERAVNTPKYLEKDIKKLTQYLIKTSKSDLEKIRAIYKWITNNIAYDVGSFLTGKIENQSAKSVLVSKKAVCEGYAALFNKMAEATSIKSEVIHGYSKGYGYTVGSDIFKQPNHAWNAVEIDNKWYLLDATWGAGYLNERQKFVRRFQEHYFLTDPEKFIYDHLPVEPKWQLIEKPVEKTEYANYVYLRPGFFYSGLSILSHSNAVIQAEQKVTISLKLEKDAMLMGQLIQNNLPIPQKLIFSQKESDDKYNIYVHLPQKGEYTLRLFSKLKEDKGQYEWALDYRIIALSEMKEGVEFPMIYGTFYESDSYLFSPMTGSLKKGENIFFKLRTPEALKAFVIDDKNRYELTKTDDIFQGNVEINSENISIAVQFSGKKSYDFLLRYNSH
ncbi:MAG: hypothetical protein OEZ22_01440 [Spirochaetia bacterium]|nr:hypothetical protein [Spirochaetia bacterium]